MFPLNSTFSLFHFWKMQGCGNNFVVSAFTRTSVQELVPAVTQRLCDAHFGIGADGVMAIIPSEDNSFDVVMKNPDGSSMGMCGNGIRCVARFVKETGFTQSKEIDFNVEGRTIRCTLDDHGGVAVDMGLPSFNPKSIPLSVTHEIVNEKVEISNTSFALTAVSMGNPHAVIFVSNLPDKSTLSSVGSVLEHHPWFPERANVEFVRIRTRNHIDVVVWERGAGATLACGTGACAAAVVGQKLGLLDETTTVTLPGGDLEISWKREGGSVILKGPAEKVFEGTWKNPYDN